ncbi:MAG: hypothetical protein QF437_33160 [Planctomycetota bacterium]|jgi:hypothetical protein|nr:hypothetical protein [Planctomycetota bacterium]MDP7135393.1 hypothetical protein [Planctomycetota bacterium]MDP7252425.1 hypothetical protein [Planctomycetota bacterium]
MINFPASTFTWEGFPWEKHPIHKWHGGFVGECGQVYHVRFNLEARCAIEDANGGGTEIFLGAPCRSEYTIAKRNLFQIPSNEWRVAFSREHSIHISRRPSSDDPEGKYVPLTEIKQDIRSHIRPFADSAEMGDVAPIIEATLAGDFLNVLSTYHDEKTALKVTLEYPVHVMNLNVADEEFQVCTGPIFLPDLRTWDGTELGQGYVADAAISSFDWTEFILRREVEAAEHEREWLDAVRGRDRLELHDPDNPPENYHPSRPKPLVFNEVWEFESENVVLRAPNK